MFVGRSEARPVSQCNRRPTPRKRLRDPPQDQQLVGLRQPAYNRRDKIRRQPREEIAIQIIRLDGAANRIGSSAYAARPDFPVSPSTVEHKRRLDPNQGLASLAVPNDLSKMTTECGRLEIV